MAASARKVFARLSGGMDGAGGAGLPGAPPALLGSLCGKVALVLARVLPRRGSVLSQPHHAGTRLCCPLHTEQRGFWWDRRLPGHAVLLATPVVSPSCWWSPASFPPASLCPRRPAWPPEPPPAPTHGTAQQDAAAAARRWALLQREEAAEGAIRSWAAERGKPDGKPEISPAEPRPHRGPRAAPASREPGGGTQGAAPQGAGADALRMPGAPSLPSGTRSPVGPLGAAGCCPPLLPAVAVSGAAWGRSRWRRQRGGWGAAVVPADGPHHVSGLCDPRPWPKERLRSSAVATGAGGPGTSPQQEQGRLLPPPC